MCTRSCSSDRGVRFGLWDSAAAAGRGFLLALRMYLGRSEFKKTVLASSSPYYYTPNSPLPLHMRVTALTAAENLG